MPEEAGRLGIGVKFRNFLSRSRSPSPSPPQPSASPAALAPAASSLSKQALPPSSVSLASRDLWKEAFEQASGKTKKWLVAQGYSTSQATTSTSKNIRDIVALVQQKESSCSDKSWKIQVGSQQIVFREFVADAVNFLTTAGDVAMAFAPPQASAPWGVVKAVLQIPVMEAEQICAVLGIIEKIVRIIRRGQVYEVLYTARNAHEDAVTNLQGALLDLYSASIDLLAESDYLFSKGTARQTLHAILNPNKAQGLVETVINLEDKLALEVQACEGTRSAQADAELNAAIKNMEDVLHKLSSPVTRVDNRVATLLEKIEKAEREKVFEDISQEPFGEVHDKVKESRTDGTGEWLLKHEGFREWEKAPYASTMLWLRGSVGSGKTYLTSKAIDYIEDNIPSTEGFAYFYCSRTGLAGMNPVNALRSYVRQLYWADSNAEGVPVKLMQRYNEAKKKGTKGLSFAVCKELILHSINHHRKTTLILDALDECDSSVHNLAEVFSDIMDEATTPVKIFVSSRPREATKPFETGSTIVVEARENEGDIRKYLQESLYSGRWYRARSEDLQLRILEMFSSRSQGMFRWVHLQVQALKRCVSDEATQTKLDELPKDLTESYDQLYDELRRRDSHDIALAERALKWVMCSYQPLAVDTLLEAIRLTPQNGSFTKASKLTEDDLLTLCQDFLALDQRRGIWEFPHLSVAEYLEYKHWSRRDADLLVARASLYLMLETFSNIDPVITYRRSLYDPDRHHEDYAPRQIDIENLATLKHPLQTYIQHHWPMHVRRYEDASTSEDEFSTELSQLLKALLRSPLATSSQYQRWIDHCRRTHLRKGWIWPKTSVFRVVDIVDLYPADRALLAMCAFKFYFTLQTWWQGEEIGEAAHVWTVTGLNPLALAAMAGSVPICRLLFGKIDVNFPLAYDRWGSVLVAAISKGQFEVAKLLVTEAKAAVNDEVQGESGTALVAAAYTGALESVQWLVEEAHAEVNYPLKRDTCGSALAAAARQGHLSIVKYLVHKGAEVNATLQGEFGSPLAAAVSTTSSNIEVEQFLIENGAEVDLPLTAGKYGSALAAGAASGNSDAIDLLIEKGAKVNRLLDNGGYGSALAAASLSRDMFESTRCLIKHGADVNLGVKIGGFGSVLIGSLCPPNMMNGVAILLEAGASMTRIYSTGDYGSALAAAAYWGHKELVQRTVEEVGLEEATATLRQSRYPKLGGSYQPFPEAQLKTVRYLTEELGLDQAVLSQIGL